MSYSNSTGSLSLGATLAGVTNGNGIMYVNTSDEISEDPVQLVYSDGLSNYTLGVGIGPVGPLSGYTPPNIGGDVNIAGILHAEDPGLVYRGFQTRHTYPELRLQSHYRGPELVFGAGTIGQYAFIGLNSVANEFNQGTGGLAGDLIIETSKNQSWIRIGNCFPTGTQFPTLSVSSGDIPIPTMGFVGVRNPVPLATLHAGCGTTAPITLGTQVYASHFGDASITVNDNLNHVEMAMGANSGIAFFGSASASDIWLRLNNTARGVITQTGNLFIGSTSPATYNPESSVMGLTGFPSAALSIAGNVVSDGSIGQVAWYNDAAGLGTRVASVQVKRSSANNNSTMTLATMNAGLLTPSVFIGATQWVGILNQSPAAALDVTGTINFSGALQPNGAPGAPGQVLLSQGPGVSPIWGAGGSGGGGNGTVNIGLGGVLAIYPGTTNTIGTGWIQNAHQITVATAIQSTRSSDITYTIPNPGDSVSNVNVVLDKGSYVIGGSWTFTQPPYGTTGGTSSDVYTPTSVTTTRSYNATSTSLDQIANVLGSLIASLQGAGIIH